MTILDRLNELMQARNLRAAQLTRELGISNSSFTDWRKGKGSPSLDVAVKFADYFHVSLDYLVKGEEWKNPNSDPSLEISTPREKQCLQKFRKLTPELQDHLLIYADGMIAAIPVTEPSESEI